MKNLIKFTALATAMLLTTSQVSAKGNSVSPNISHAPAIEASYDQIQNDLAKHVGINVRWGGQIIDSQKLDKVTRVTLIAYPLDSKGRPSARQAVKGDTFVVDFDKSTLPRKLSVGNFITVYGSVDGGLKLTNGPLEKLVPVVTSQDAKKWKLNNVAGVNRARDSYAFQQLRYHDSLGYGGRRYNNGFGFRSSRLGFRGNRYGYGGRGFSRGRRYGRH